MTIIGKIKSKFKFKSFVDFTEIFKDDKTCREALEWIIWHGRPVSPFDHTSKVYKCKNGRYKCKNTGKYFTILTGTIFENSKISLKKWFIAIFYLSSDKVGVSSVRLSELIGVTQKTAWFIAHKIRSCMACENDNELSGVVEADEAYIYGVSRFKHYNKRFNGSQGKSLKGKNIVFGALQQNGKLNMRVIKDTKKETLVPILLDWVRSDATLYTDEHNGYNSAKGYYNHKFVRHKAYQYVDEDITTNHIENIWSHFKRMLKGAYKLPKDYHLQKYVNEYVFIYNTRKMKLLDKFYHLIGNINIKITYEEVLHGY